MSRWGDFRTALACFLTGHHWGDLDHMGLAGMGCYRCGIIGPNVRAAGFSDKLNAHELDVLAGTVDALRFGTFAESKPGNERNPPPLDSIPPDGLGAEWVQGGGQPQVVHGLVHTARDAQSPSQAGEGLPTDMAVLLLLASTFLVLWLIAMWVHP